MAWFVKSQQIANTIFKIDHRVAFDEKLIREKFGWNPDVNPQDAQDLDRYVVVSSGVAMKSGPWTVEEN